MPAGKVLIEKWLNTICDSTNLDGIILDGGRQLENIGCEPDEVYNRKNAPAQSFKPLLDAALNYIKNH